MGDLLTAALLGLIEGLTEFLPVSSTGHLLLSSHFLGFESAGKTFEVVIQLGAVLALLTVYFGKLWQVFSTVHRDPASARFVTSVTLAFLPAVVVGVLAHDFIKAVLFETPRLIALMLILGGVVLLFVDRLAPAPPAQPAALVDRRGVQPGDPGLQIGCCWGGFAEYAAGVRGLRLTCLTISREQYEFAVARMARAGLSDRVTIKLQDYRDERGTYDGIASIEMFEAVGEKYWPVYFAAVRDRLKPGARATLQIITVPDHRFAAYRKTVDFIQKYIFPGGMLPSPSALRSQAQQAGLHVTGSAEFGESYSQTLRRWYDTFNQRWPEVARLGFDDRFRRMWNFYLTSCAGAFEGGNCDVTQITVTRPA